MCSQFNPAYRSWAASDSAEVGHAPTFFLARLPDQNVIAPAGARTKRGTVEESMAEKEPVHEHVAQRRELPAWKRPRSRDGRSPPPEPDGGGSEREAGERLLGHRTHREDHEAPEKEVVMSPRRR